MKYFILVGLFLGMFSQAASAHRASDAYIHVSAKLNNLDGRIEISARDLEWELGLDSNGDQKITWGEIRLKTTEIQKMVKEGLGISNHDSSCPIQVSDLMISHHSDGAYIAVPFSVTCDGTPSPKISINYNLLFDRDADHRALLNFETDNGEQSSDIFSPARRVIYPYLNHGENKTIWRSFLLFLEEGIDHIWAGYDHMLFLLSLLLPSVLIRKDGQWLPAPSSRKVCLNALMLVTAFTVAHATSLTLISFGLWYPPPSRLVESAIALTLFVSALNNIRPFWRADRWLIALLFGFIHGLGFATALKDLGLTTKTLIVALLGFNFGVDIGQIAVSAAFLVVALKLRWNVRFYVRNVLIGGSLLCCIISLIWFIERTFNL